MVASRDRDFVILDLIQSSRRNALQPQGAQISTDRNLRLQYLAGMSLNSNMGEQDLASIRAHYRFPEHTFIGSDERIRVLMQLRFRPVRLR
jgi:spermidine synthase